MPTSATTMEPPGTDVADQPPCDSGSTATPEQTPRPQDATVAPHDMSENPLAETPSPVQRALTKEDIFAQKLIRELEDLELVFDDGVPMESPWHRFQMNLLIELTHRHLSPGTHFYVGGNMFIYFSLTQARNRDYRGPDYFLVLGVDGTRDRDGWVVWEEGGRYPDLIIELLSPSTRTEDLVTKKRLYAEVFRTPEYFCYGREGAELKGWRLSNGNYRSIDASPEGRLWSKALNAFVGPHHEKRWGIEAHWLHLYDANGNIILTYAEAEKERAEGEKERADAEKERADAEKERAESEKERAESEKERAEGEKERADAEKERADAAEKKVKAAEEEREHLLARIHELESARETSSAESRPVEKAQ